jgi:hypothetical protein
MFFFFFFFFTISAVALQLHAGVTIDHIDTHPAYRLLENGIATNSRTEAHPTRQHFKTCNRLDKKIKHGARATMLRLDKKIKHGARATMLEKVKRF